jgi:glucuronyl/N-acetylglucosaminyl transferase EXT2
MLLVIVMILFYTTLSILKSEVEHHSTIASNVEVLVLENKDLPNRSTWWKEDCFFHNCFEINECQYTDPPDRIKVYIYPDYRYSLPDHGNIQLPVSKEYKEILDTIYDSVYYEPSPVEACVFIPSIDTLNQRTIDVSLVTKLLSRLPWWNSGTNHIIFSMLPGQHPTYNVTPDFLYDKAILAGSQFNTISYRIGFDLAIPVYNSLTKQDIYLNNIIGNRKYLLSVLIQLGADPAVISRIQTNERVLLLGPCKQCDDCWIKKRCGLKHGVEHSWNYPQVLQESNFCLILPGHRHEVSDLLDILMMGCIPVIVRDYQFMLPFSEVLDWSLPAVFVWIEELNNLMDILKPVQLNDKQIFVNFFYHRYFNSIKAITMTTLDVLNGRVFPITGHSYEYWNVPDEDFQHKLNSKVQVDHTVSDMNIIKNCGLIQLS